MRNKGSSDGCDVVYMLGRGSRYENTELRYSLRALQAHLTDLRKVYLVGEKPFWARNVVHLPAYDSFGSCVECNLLQKVWVASKHAEVSETFLIASDDQLLLHDVTSRDLLQPFGERVIQPAESATPGSVWETRLFRTADLVGRPCRVPEPHAISPCFRQKALAGFHRHVDWISKERCDRTFYLYLYWMMGVPVRPACPTDHQFIVDTGAARRAFDTPGLRQAGYTDAVLEDPVFRRMLQTRYPTPSAFESRDALPVKWLRHV